MEAAKNDFIIPEIEMAVNSDDIQADFISDGAQKCLDNAENIYADAILLNGHNRHVRAFALFHIAAEEAAKGLQLLVGYLVGTLDTADQISSFFGQKGYGKSHLRKIRGSLTAPFPFLYLLRETNDNVEALFDYFAAQYGKAGHFVKDKERSLYVDFDGAYFTIPDTSISVARCEEMKQSADLTIHITRVFLQALSTRASMVRKQMRSGDLDKIKEQLRVELNTSLNASTIYSQSIHKEL
ncbi:MAG: AbiV family abortive infection protein [Flavobacteriales bacterium]